uniref:DM domain-containing protein n=1 Tax=Anabas testudineus TaxID=64144 RepID=A0A3Q1IRE1_ANATE
NDTFYINLKLSEKRATPLGSSSGCSGLPRQPKCTRCRHHGIVVPQKGHMKLCPFLKCACWRCLLITERTRITALQRNLRRAEENKPQTKAKRPRDSEARPAAPGASSRPLANGDPGSVVTSERSPLDLRCGPAGSDRTTVLTCPPTETPGNFTPLSKLNNFDLTSFTLLNKQQTLQNGRCQVHIQAAMLRVQTSPSTCRGWPLCLLSCSTTAFMHPCCSLTSSSVQSISHLHQSLHRLL